MIIKEKRWLSRFVAMLCVLTMVVGVLTPASVGVAADSKVKTIKIKMSDSEIIYADADKNPMLDGSGECSDYNYTVADGYITVTPNSTFFPTNVTFYAYADEKPMLKITEGTVNSFVSGDAYRIFVNLSTAKEDNVTIEMIKKYTVTFPDSTSDYTLDAQYENATIQYEEGDDVTFNVTLLNKDKKLVVRVGSTILSPNNEQPSDNKYEYTIEKLNGNKRVTISVEEQKFKITEPKVALEAGYLYMKNSSSNEVAKGGSFSFTVYPKDGYSNPKVYIKNTSDEEGSNKILLNGYNGLYIYSNIQDDMTIIIESGNLQEYNVSFDDGIGYSFSEIKGGDKLEGGAGTYKVQHGKNVEFKVSASEGYKITRVSANNNITLTANSGTYTLENVTADTVISVVVSKESYSITYDETDTTGYDSVKGETENVEYGTTYTFYITPKDGFKAPTVTAKLTEKEDIAVPVIADGNRYTINKITGSTTITITPADKETRKVTFNDNPGYYSFNDIQVGKDLKETLSSVDYGSTVKFKVTLDNSCSQYENSYTVKANGAKLTKGEGEYYTIENITENQIIEVTGVEKNKYTVTLQNEAGYKLGTTESTSVSHGTRFTFSWDISDGYKNPTDILFDNIEQNKSDLGSTGTYSFEVTQNTTVKLKGVTPIKYKVTVDNDQNDNASVTDIGSQGKTDISHGGSYSFEVKPDKYYKVIKVKVDDVPIPDFGGVYTIENIKADKKITVETEPVKLTVHYVDDRYNTSITDKEFTISNINDKENGTVSSDELGKIDYVENRLYTFDGWDNADKAVIDTNNDTEIILTAKWKLNENVVKNGLSLETTGNWSTQKNEDQLYEVLFKTIISLVAKGNAEYTDNVKIKAFGTLYSNESISNVTQYIDEIKDRNSKGSPSETLMKAPVTDAIFNYYKNLDTPLSVKDLGEKDFFLLKLTASRKYERHAVGWLEVEIDGKTVIVINEESVQASSN